MARSFYAAAIGASLVALIVVLQLSVNLGRPDWALFRSHAASAEAYDGSQPVAHGSSFAAENLEARAGSTYLLGVGKADITGPVVELNLMGYANLSQVGTGLRQRLFSRAFIIGDPSNTNDRFIYLVLDTQSGDTAIRAGILQGLQALGPDYAMYTTKNVAVTGTHSHSGPAAWLNYLLPQVTSLGFDKQSYQAIVDGTLLSIQRAHESLTTGTLSVGTTNITDANINRSLWAYLANPASEQAMYTDNVDKTMTLLKFTRASDGKDIGVLSWFAVHGTSMLGNNTIITGDNKGVAAYLFEKAAATLPNAAPGFVAGFSQANVGDTSPNVLGAWCEDGSNQMCSLVNSTCADGTSEACHGRGPFPGLNDAGTKSCFEIGTRQFNGASSLYTSMVSGAGIPITGSGIRSFHTFVDYSNFTFTLPNGTQAKTCPAALGFSFAAGTTDGPGAFDFTQGDSGSPNNPFWAVVGDLIHTPSPEQVACQAPKPILLDAGETTVPYLWAPNIVDIQMLRVGQFIIIVSPGEATTMSGRRWRSAIQSAASSQSIVPAGTTPIVVLGGPANSYTHYIATPEEYAIQRYEGASTLYGQHTLDAHIHNTLVNLPFLADSSTTSPAAGPSPPINTNNSLSFITPVVQDNAPIGSSFGKVLTDVSSSYARGAVVRAVFQGADPRNNLRLEGTYAAVEKLEGSTWTQVVDDVDWELLFEWVRTNFILGYSEVTISWETSSTTPTGTYRLRYSGDEKPLIGSIKSFNGTSGTFTLT